MSMQFANAIKDLRHFRQSSLREVIGFLLLAVMVIGLSVLFQETATSSSVHPLESIVDRIVLQPFHFRATESFPSMVSFASIGSKVSSWFTQLYRVCEQYDETHGSVLIPALIVGAIAILLMFVLALFMFGTYWLIIKPRFDEYNGGDL